LAGQPAVLVSVHLAAPLQSRLAGTNDPGQAMIAHLSERYQPGYGREGRTYDFTELATAAGLQVLHTIELTIKRINAKLYLGSGQAEEVLAAAKACGAQVIAVSAPLNPVHQRNWEELGKLPVLNRYDLIFSIFDQNAHTAEGKLQVELARLRYELPRIITSYEALDPLAGGIGTLGPGEQLTERIKRRHRERIHDIEARLDKLRQQRALRRRQRIKSGIFTASLVGYTNVGKSTLLNRLTGSGVLVADQYFATLDPSARVLRLLDPGENSIKEILLTDTVGFLDDLPKELVQSFRATLEEMEGSHLLIHLADASHPQVVMQIHAVRKIIQEIRLAQVPELLVFNKCDQLAEAELAELLADYPDALALSAITGVGIQDLLDRLSALTSGFDPRLGVLAWHTEI
jgi:GTPase